MITVNLSGHMGNNLFQYSAGRLLAEHLGFELDCAGISHFPNTFLIKEGKKFFEPVVEITDKNFNFDEIVFDKRERKLELNGYFQKARYLIDNKPLVQKFLFQPDLETVPVLDVVVHVRLGDYVTYDWDLPYSFYDIALSEVCRKNLTIWIATDEPGHPFFLRFKSWKPKFLKTSTYETFLIMRRSKNLIISRSTYSWWAAFLGNHDMVIGPKPQSGFWSDLEMSNGLYDLVDSKVFLPMEYDEKNKRNSIERAYYIFREANYLVKQKTKTVRKFTRSFLGV